MTQDSEFAFVTLFDAPLYSLVVLKTDSMKKVEQRALLAVMAYEAYTDYLENTKLALEFKKDQEMKEEDTGPSLTDIYESMQYLNCDHPFVVGRQLRVLQAGQTSFVICTFSDGRTLTLSFDHKQAAS